MKFGATYDRTPAVFWSGLLTLYVANLDTDASNHVTCHDMGGIN